MKLSLPIKLAVFVVLLLAAVLNVACAADTASLVILHTNDLHGQMRAEKDNPGAARIAAYFRQVREKHPNVLVLDAGDSVSGTPLSLLFEGEPIFEIMSAMKYDAAVLGNHEFDYGYKKIRKYRELAAHPLLCANAFAPDNSLLADAPYRILDAGGVRVGIIGVILESTPVHIIRAGNEGIRFTPQIEAVRKIVPRIRKKCDLIIALTHLDEGEDTALAKAVDGIDLIVNGHSDMLEKPVKAGNTFIVQAGEHGTYIGRVEIKIDLKNRKIIGLEGKLIKASDLPLPDAEIGKLVDKWEKKITEKLDIRIATSTRTIEEEEVKELFEKIIRQVTGADLAYYNLGGIRKKIYEGDVTVRDVWKIEPFGNTIVKLKIKGEDLGGVLLEELKASGVKIEPDREYTVATNNFIAERTENEIGSPVAGSVNTHVLVRDAVIEYIKKNGID